jgi:hypothetical protein
MQPCKQTPAANQPSDNHLNIVFCLGARRSRKRTLRQLCHASYPNACQMRVAVQRTLWLSKTHQQSCLLLSTLVAGNVEFSVARPVMLLGHMLACTSEAHVAPVKERSSSTMRTPPRALYSHMTSP